VRNLFGSVAVACVFSLLATSAIAASAKSKTDIKSEAAGKNAKAEPAKKDSTNKVAALTKGDPKPAPGTKADAKRKPASAAKKNLKAKPAQTKRKSADTKKDAKGKTSGAKKDAKSKSADSKHAKSKSAHSRNGKIKSADAKKNPRKKLKLWKPKEKKPAMVGIASVYRYKKQRRGASGETINFKSMIAAHRTLRFGTHVRVTNRRNGKSVVVRIIDRGPFVRGRVIDLSPAAARRIGLGWGLAPVTLAVVSGTRT
jgi:rare lipoprotein A